ncbi:MAG: glycosyltransferase [Nitrososphaerota archaeon]|nr:glycosyltransferase [Nitrososphaerota archaeon]
MLKTAYNPILWGQKAADPAVSIIIPTYKRGHLLHHVLEALTNQTDKDFEVLLIVKPSGDKTERVIEEYRERLKINLVLQHFGYVTDALNLGLKNAAGKIIVFIDDDAIPFPNLVQSYILAYSTPEIGGVAGDVVPVVLQGDVVCEFKDTPSEIVLAKTPKNALAQKLGARPLQGLEDYLIYISKAGFVSLNYNVVHKMFGQSVNSLLAKGANMSVSSTACAGFQFPTSWILGLTFEQYLGWHLWKKGYRVIFNPNIKAYHIHHGQSLSRHIKDTKKSSVLCAENRFLFYRLYGSEPGLSLLNRSVLLLIELLADLRGICLHKDLSRIGMFKDKIFAELIGVRWLICKKLGLNYSPLAELQKMLP